MPIHMRPLIALMLLGGCASGRTYMAIWYVPEVKRWVKSMEEYYTPGGVRNERYVSELERFEVASQAPQ